jgi:hypothetical protein
MATKTQNMGLTAPQMADQVGSTIPALATNMNAIDTEFGQRGINVKWFGATGNGVTDDTQAIQSAINAAGQFGIVLFPPGVYLVGQLTLPTGITLIGTSSGRMNYEDSTSTSTLMLKNGANSNVLYIPSGVQYGNILNLQIDGNHANQTSTSYGIYFADNATGTDSMWLVQNCYIHHCYSDGIYVGLNVQAVRIIDNEVLYNSNNGMTIKGSDCKIERNEVGMNVATGIYVSAWVTRLIDNDIYSNYGPGVKLDTNSDFSVLVGNGIDRNYNQGLNIVSNNVTITGNSFHTNGQAGNDLWATVDVQATCQNVTITGNKFGQDPSSNIIPTWDINIHPGATNIIHHGNTYTSSAHVQGHCSDGQAWAASTAYVVGQTVNANGNVYQCTTAGTSGTTAPSGTGSSITDGTVTWAYVAPLQMLKFMGAA